MKSLKSILATMCVCIAMPISAQIGNNPSASTNGRTEYQSRLSVGYLSTSSSGKYSKIDDGDSPTVSGIAVQYTTGKRISNDRPIYLEYGIRASWGTYSFDGDYFDDCTLTKVSANIPVSVGYKLYASEGLTIMPYTGLHLTGNIIGKISDDDDSISMFDKDDVGGKEFVWNRIQYGWQIGVNVIFNKVTVGLEYGYDFNELYKKCNTSDLLISIGINI